MTAPEVRSVRSAGREPSRNDAVFNVAAEGMEAVTSEWRPLRHDPATRERPDIKSKRTGSLSGAVPPEEFLPVRDSFSQRGRDQAAQLS